MLKKLNNYTLNYLPYTLPYTFRYRSVVYGLNYLLHTLEFQDMGKVPPLYIFAAFIPAVMIAGLYFFDHSVASQMAQQMEFNLQKPSSYHYDLLLLGIMVCSRIMGHSICFSFSYFVISYQTYILFICKSGCLNFMVSDYDLWVAWTSSFEWSPPTVPHAHQKSGSSQETGRMVFNYLMFRDFSSLVKSRSLIRFLLMWAMIGS